MDCYNEFIIYFAKIHIIDKKIIIICIFYRKILYLQQNRKRMKENPILQLSIIVPVYNVEDYVRPCIESIFRQGLDEDFFEVIIVNDGTEDRSIEVIQDIIEMHENITVINQENQGLSVARNNGIAVAKGEYILMPDSDDLLIENSLKPLLEKAQETKADMVTANYISMSSEEIKAIKKCPVEQTAKPVFEESSGPQMYVDHYQPYRSYVWRILFKRNFLLDNNIYFSPGISFEDIPFTHECYLKAKLCLKTSWRLNIYRIRHDSTSFPGNFSRKKAKDYCMAITLSWALKDMEGITPQLSQILKDKVFMSYKSLLQKLCYVIKNHSDRVAVLKELKRTCPSLKFNNGIIQKTHTYLFRTWPNLYIMLMMTIKRLKWGHN